MISLKHEGKVQRIRYAGDGFNLAASVGIFSFDDFKATIDILDQPNFLEIQKTNPQSGIYCKLGFAQGIWTSQELMRKIKSCALLRDLFNKPPVPDYWSDYFSRFNEFNRISTTNTSPNCFSKFELLAGSGNQFVIFGSSSIRHMREAVKIQNRLNSGETFEATKYYELFQNLDSASEIAHT